MRLIALYFNQQPISLSARGRSAASSVVDWLTPAAQFAQRLLFLVPRRLAYIAIHRQAHACYDSSTMAGGSPICLLSRSTACMLCLLLRRTISEPDPSAG